MLMNPSLIKTEYLATGQAAPFTGQWVNTALCKNGFIVTYVNNISPKNFTVTQAGMSFLNGTYVRSGSKNGKPKYVMASSPNLYLQYGEAGPFGFENSVTIFSPGNWILGSPNDPDNYYYATGYLEANQLSTAVWLPTGPGGAPTPVPLLAALYDTNVNIDLQVRTKLNQDPMFLEGGSAEALSFYKTTGVGSGYGAPVFFDSPIAELRLVATAGTAPVFSYITYQN
jgi:hypothetical protein